MPRPLSLAVQAHVVPWHELDWPIDWPGVLGRSAPLVLEIGFGNGAFLADLAAAHPGHDHVGIELSWSSALRLFKRLRARALTNVRVLLVDAVVALEHLFPPASLAAVHVNHPCPWPKARHEERRLVSPAFLRLLADRMREGAPLTIVTDHAEYAGWTRDALEGCAGLRSRHATSEVASIPGRVPTKYERKATDQGVPIHYFEWERRGPAAPVRPPLAVPAFRPDPRLSDAMPSLTLRGAPRAESLLEGFEPATFRARDGDVLVTVKLAAAFRQLGQPVWLVETLVVEDGLRQELGILVVARGEDLLVKLSSVGRPHPTFGVKHAVWRVGRWLVERHPGLEVASENLGAAATAGEAPGSD